MVLIPAHQKKTTRRRGEGCASQGGAGKKMQRILGGSRIRDLISCIAVAVPLNNIAVPNVHVSVSISVSPVFVIVSRLAPLALFANPTLKRPRQVYQAQRPATITLTCTPHPLQALAEELRTALPGLQIFRSS
ncbi:hypothetical protein NDU88_004284 [Pleurodeles waltl]|uniref:Uncharacterized protein n=1 Tax=Pleurodeles waltl TaxID=8319 RepID=A0AAV7KXA0_PLEWA|nr:hypothetical protein NDU88_004284 [Pleurodeles waltl]